MDQLQTSGSVNASSGLAGLLAALQGGASSESELAKLFSNLLSQNQFALKEQTQQKTASSTANGAGSSTSSAVTQTSNVQGVAQVSAGKTISQALPSLKTLAVAWHLVVNRLEALATKTKSVSTAQSKTSDATSASTASNSSQADSGAADNNAVTTTTASTASSATNTDATASCASAVSAGQTSSAANSSDASAADDDSDSDTKTAKLITDMLSELQLLGGMILKQLQSSAATNGSAGPQTATAVSTSGDSSGAASSTNNGDLLGVNASSDAVGASNDLQNVLQDLVANLQKAGIGSSATDASAVGDAGSSTATTNAAVSGGDSSTSSSASISFKDLRDLLASAADIAAKLEQNVGVQSSVNGIATVNPSAKPAAVSVPVSTTLDAKTLFASTDDANKATATNAVTTNTALTPQVTDPAPLLQPALVKAADAAQEKSFAAPSGSTKEAQNQTAFAASVATSDGAALDAKTTGQDAGFDLDKNNSNASGAANLTADTTKNAVSLDVHAVGSGATNFASQLAAAKAATVASTGLPSAVEQVMLQLNRNVKSGNDQISLQLNPAELGRVSIKLDIAPDGKVQGTVVATNPATLESLLKDVRSLERALQDAGLRADPGSLQFSLGDSSNQSFAQAQKGSTQSSKNGSTAGSATDLAAVTNDQTEIYYLTPNRVNLRV